MLDNPAISTALFCLCQFRRHGHYDIRKTKLRLLEALLQISQMAEFAFGIVRIDATSAHLPKFTGQPVKVAIELLVGQQRYG